MFSKIILFLVCCLIFTSCNSKKDSKFDIHFSTDSSKIIFSGIDEVAIFQAQKNNPDNLISVFAIASNSAEQEKPISGQIEIEGQNLIFKPDAPFVKGQSYLIRTMLNSSFGKTTDILKSDLGHTIKAHEKILNR